MKKMVTTLMLFGLMGAQGNAWAGAKKSLPKKSNESGEISIDVKKKVLKNGLTILVVENFKLPIFSYYSYYQVGSKYESPGITGASHFLEHMMFKGTPKYPAGAFDKIVEGNGGKNNAYTTNDLTVYYENLPSENFDKIVDLEADRMQNLLIEEKSFESERAVVLEERKMRYENSDRGRLYLTMMQQVFKGTPYGTSVIGTVPDLKSVSKDQIYKYFKTHYAPNNAVVVFVGAVKAEDAFKAFEQKYGNIPPTKDLEKLKKASLDKLGFDFKAKFGRHVKLKGQSSSPSFSLAFKGIKIGTREGFVLDILSSVLGGGESSYLNSKFVSGKKPVLGNIHAANYTLMESGVFFIGGKLLKNASLSKVKKNLMKSLQASCSDKKIINSRAVQKVKNQYMVDLVSELDTNAGVARFLGDREVYYGGYDFYKKEMGIYNSITLEELRAACKKYLKEDQSIFLSIWNKH